MRILDRDVVLGIDFYGNFTKESLVELQNNHLVCIEDNEVYYYSQKQDSYFFLTTIDNSIDEIVIQALDKILENEINKVH